MHRCVNAELAQGDRIAYYKDLVPSENGGGARCEASLREPRDIRPARRAPGLDLPGPTSASRPTASPVPTAGLPAAEIFISQMSLPPAVEQRYAENRMKLLLRLALAADLVALMTVDARKLDAHQRRRAHVPRLAALPRTSAPLAGRRHALGMDASPACVCGRAARRRAHRRGVAASAQRSPFVVPTLGVIAVLFFAQVFLGAETVRLANRRSRSCCIGQPRWR